MLRSCYTGTWHLPGWGDVAGYYYFSDEGTPFLPGWSWLGSRNWHDGDGSPWPAFGEKESSGQAYRKGTFAGERPLPISLGEEFCLEQETGIEFTPLAWRGGLPVRCFGPLEEDMPTGVVVAFAGQIIPTGWLLCDGTAINRVFYSELFAVIGITWGPGDGVNTFNTPDLRSRTIVGSGTGPGLSPRLLASSGGAENHVLTIAQIPAHTHTMLQLATMMPGPGPNVVGPGGPPVLTTNATGGGLGHPQMPPFRGVTWIIKT